MALWWRPHVFWERAAIRGTKHKKVQLSAQEPGALSAPSLVKNSQTNVTIIGHTDNTGSSAHNADLSVHRASAVKTYLTDNGINGSRLNINGRGETEPIADNNTAAGRAQNRRVEIVIV